jgi:hypothetical protein
MELYQMRKIVKFTKIIAAVTAVLTLLLTGVQLYDAVLDLKPRIMHEAS